MDNGAEVRIDKIVRIIGQCGHGIHDISRVEPDRGSGLPRMNMPFELGLFLGAQRYGNARQKEKTCIIFDRHPYRYQQFLSDIAGQDIRVHAGDPGEIIRVVRNALMTTRAPEVLIHRQAHGGAVRALRAGVAGALRGSAAGPGRPRTPGSCPRDQSLASAQPWNPGRSSVANSRPSRKLRKSDICPGRFPLPWGGCGGMPPAVIPQRGMPSLNCT
jgi:hypothetical protein